LTLYLYYAGRRIIFDITDVSTINSAVKVLSGDWMSDSFFKDLWQDSGWNLRLLEH